MHIARQWAKHLGTFFKEVVLDVGVVLAREHDVVHGECVGGPPFGTAHVAQVLAQHSAAVSRDGTAQIRFIPLCTS